MDPTLTQNAAPAEIPAAVPDWIMLARTGVWAGGPKGGRQVVTQDRLAGAKAYFEARYVPNSKDVPLDWNHASVFAAQRGERAPAAGWIGQMDLRADGTELWGLVQWTTEGMNSVAARQFRYPSPVILWNHPDPVTGEIIPMRIHSVALTNTPRMLELASLNEQDAGTDPGDTPEEGGGSMDLLTQIANALEVEPEQAASMLGLSGTEDKEVAQALVANAQRVAELEAELAAVPALPESVANALGVEPDAELTSVNAAIIRLKAPGAGLDAVRSALGLAEDASEAGILSAIGELHEDRHGGEVDQLIANAIEAGKITPAQKGWWKRIAEGDMDAARQAIEGLPVVTNAQHVGGQRTPAQGITDEERAVARLLGISDEVMLAGRNAS